MAMELGEKRGQKFIKAIKEGKIQFEKAPNCGKEFYGAYEQLHKERFCNYLGSCSRYLANKRMEEHIRGFSGF